MQEIYSIIKNHWKKENEDLHSYIAKRMSFTAYTISIIRMHKAFDTLMFPMSIK
jgi:hypothetical protein